MPRTQLASILAALPEAPAERKAFIKNKLEAEGKVTLNIVEGSPKAGQKPRTSQITIVKTPNVKTPNDSRRDQSLHIKLVTPKGFVNLRGLQEKLISGDISEQELHNATIGRPVYTFSPDAKKGSYKFNNKSLAQYFAQRRKAIQELSASTN